MNHVDNKQQGFTLIELILAMAFISVLLLGIAMTIIQIGAIYNRGITLREVNQMSRDIADDLRRNVPAASELDLAVDYVPYPTATSPTGGRLCLGTYSYVWNYAKGISAANPSNPNDPSITQYGLDASGTRPADKIRFVRVPDTGKIYCAKNTSGAIAYTQIRGIDTPKTQELLKAGDHDLGIHQFAFVTPVPATSRDDSTGQQLYTVNFTIGTSKITALDTTQSACLPANDLNSDPLYCNVQQFTLVLRVGNGV